MAEKGYSKNVTLPSDFVEFMRRNYEIIEDIEKKVKQFEVSSDDLTPYHRLRQAQFKKVFDSVDSCFSDSDVCKVISANVEPKVSELDAKEDRVQVDPALWSTSWDKEDSDFNPDFEDFNYVSKKFPLISLGYDKSGKDVVDDSAALIVNGVPLSFSQRLVNQGNKSVFSFLHNMKTANSAAQKRKDFAKWQTKNNYSKIALKNKIRYPKCKCQSTDDTRNEHFSALQDKQVLSIGPLTKIFSDSSSNTRSHNSNNHFVQRDNNQSILKSVRFNSDQPQLTLPPLHSSVLTLLGQRTGIKPSPRNLLGQIHEQSVSSGASRQKKLRRHGRRKKDNDKSDGDQDPTEAVVRSASMKPMTQDEINETQISSFIPEENESEEEAIRNRASDEKLQASLHNLTESRRALYYVLDDYVGGKPWSLKEMKELENEISSLSSYFEKYQTKFNIEDIKMKQDTWLSFPRTWSRASASFGVPYDIKKLKEMTPREYLLTCVKITEPRKHLYDMVFQRYRMKENPTGSHISIKMLLAALGEVIGRQLSMKETDELCFTYLGIEDLEIQINKQLFAGISAFCERIYAVYSFEDLNECYTCDRTDMKKDKLRCHQNQKSLLERTDLAFLSAKIRDGQVQSQLSKLLHALCERD